jgi:hypothetical protein
VSSALAVDKALFGDYVKIPDSDSLFTNICVVKAPAFMRGDETTLNFLWLNATKN